VARARPPGHSAADFLPPRRTLDALREAAAGCRGCDLWTRGTQTVFGEGAAGARVMLVGEQPGNDEDLAGRPFVGPAGQLLDRALAAAGVARGDAYVTNVVKHFKWEPRGKRRIHARPGTLEIGACLPWLEAELAVVKPEVLVCLGATAAQALIGRDFRITRQRGEFVPTDWSRWTIATYHPSAVLRAPDEDARAKMADMLQEDLKKVAAKLHELEAAG
jgi:DNA polymerase